MEASLLPSKSVQALCSEVLTAAVPIRDEMAAKLRSEFDVPYFNAWVIVLDEVGETRTSFIADQAGAGCTDDAAANFPGQLVQLISAALEKGVSTQELNRRWKKARSLRAFNAFVKQLNRSCAYRTVTSLCNEIKADILFPPILRTAAEITAFLASAQGGHTTEQRRALIESGESLLAAHPDHALSRELAITLFGYGYGRCFDVSAKLAAGIARMSKLAEQLGTSKKIQRHLRRLANFGKRMIRKISDDYLEIDSKIAEINHVQYYQLHLAGQLGDAETVLRVLSELGTEAQDEFAELAAEAKSKLARLRDENPIAAQAEDAVAREFHE